MLSLKQTPSCSYLLAVSAVARSYSAAVLVCNKGNMALTNLDVNSRKIPRLDVGEGKFSYLVSLVNDHLQLQTVRE